MELRTYTTGPDLLARAGGFLRERELEHGFHLGMAGRLVGPTADGAEPPYLVCVQSAGRVCAVAIRTPPHNVVLSHIAPGDRADAFGCLVDDLRARGGTLPGVFGPRDEAEDFAARWTQAAGVSARVAMAMREFAIEHVAPPAGVPGAMRAATLEDLELLHAWGHAFIDEAGLPEADRVLATRVRTAERVAKGQYWLWCVDGSPSAYAGGAGTPRIGRVGPVYTPPEFRNRGYGTALTAAVSQRLLDAGAWRVCLSTDLANPTSNRIYQTIGYRPLSDRAMMAFEPAL